MWTFRTQMGDSILADGLILEAFSILSTISDLLDENAKVYSEFVVALLMADDDDADPSNGTPNQTTILNSFGQHHIYPNGYILSGTIEGDAILQYDTYITGSVTVSSGGTLTIQPGITIKFCGYYNITVNEGSKILAEGTEQEPILFTSATGTTYNSWGGIYIYSSNNSFKNCEVRYGNYSIYFYGNPNPTTGNIIEECEFQQNKYGPCYSCSAGLIKNCQSHHNNYYGIYCVNSDVLVEGNRLEYNGKHGCYSQSGNFLEFYGNVIRMNSLYGISTKSSDHLHIGEPYSWYGYNTVRMNGDREINAYTGTPHVEINYASIRDNSGYEIYNYPSNPWLFAQQGWFGEYPPDPADFYGPITINTPLESQPDWEDETRSGGLSKVLAYGGGRDITERIRQLKEIINTNPTSPEAMEALYELYGIIRADYRKNIYGERIPFYNLLNQITQKHQTEPIGKLALRYQIV